MSNCCININCPANAVCVCVCEYFLSSPSFSSTAIHTAKNVDNSPAALSIVMELWKYYKSCTFIRVNKYIEPAHRYQARTLSFSSHLVCKYGHNGNVKSRFLQNETKEEREYNNDNSNKTAQQSIREEKKRKEKWIHYIDGYLLEFIAFTFGVWIKNKYGQIKKNPFQWQQWKNGWGCWHFSVYACNRLHCTLQTLASAHILHPVVILRNSIFLLISPENAH